MNNFAFFWGFRKIKRRGRLTGCMILIAFVTAPLVLALVFSNSMMSGITNKYIYLSNGHILIKGESDLKADNNKILFADNVITGSALAYSSEHTASFNIKGIKSDYFNYLRSKQISFITDDNNSLGNLNGITLSRKTAEILNVDLGDRIALMVVPDSAAGVPAPKLVKVSSLFYSGYDQLDENIAFVSYDYARTLFPSSSSISTEVILADSLMDNIEEVTHTFDEDVLYSTWEQNNASLYRNFVNSRQMIIIVLLLISCVAAYYSASVAQQMIQDDMSEIAIMKLLGCSNRLVRKSSFISVFSVTFAGVILGLTGGLLISFNLSPLLNFLAERKIDMFSYYLLDFDIKIPFGDIFLVLFSLCLVSAVSIFFSLRKTRRISPIQLFTTL